MTDILLFIGTIFCVIGFISYFFHCYIFAYIGAILIFIVYIIDYFSGKIKNIGYLFMMTIIGILASINFKYNYFNVNLFMCIICVDVIATYIIGFFSMRKKKKNILKRLKKYYYIEGCLEFQNLINYWYEKGIYNDNYRIKEEKDYKNLKTHTAKIVFLFNLILDLNECYTEYRIYISTEPVINYEFINKAEIRLKIYKNKLNNSNEILCDLKNSPYIQPYQLQLNNIYHNFKDIYDILVLLHSNIRKQNMNSIQNNISFDTLMPLIQKLDIVANSLSDNLINFQNVINANDIVFNSLKTIDSKIILKKFNNE